MRRRVVVVVNPAAGRVRRKDPGRIAVDAFRRADPRADIERVSTTGPGDARRLAAAAAGSRADLVLAVGGDGTANEVANGLLGSATALGVVPTGTMNLLARVLGLPVDAEAAATRLAVSRGRRDVRPGSVAGRAFLLMAGVGFDAWVLRELLSGARGKIGFGDYVRGAVRGLRTFPFDPLDARAGARSLPCHSIVIGRAPLYGGFLRPTPRADLASDRFEVCAFAGKRAALLRSIAAMWSGAHGSGEGSTSLFADVVEVASPRAAMPFQLDGELAGTLPARFEISPSPVRLAF